MSLKIFETKWKTALTSILEELTEQQFRKLMFNLVKIPQGVKMDKTREEIPYIIIQYYGTEGSISVIDKEMKQLPRNDAAVQEHLRPFVEKLKKQRQKEKMTMSKPAADSGSVAKKQKPAAVTVVLNAQLFLFCFFDHVGVVKSKQKTEKPAESTKTSQIYPAGVVEPKQMQISSLKPAESTKTPKVQSAPVQMGRIKILRLKMSNKTNTHLEVEFNNQAQTFFITTRLLANTLGFRRMTI
ncbi:hypothetical protein ABVT39_027976 [Epinephelus coioides]